MPADTAEKRYSAMSITSPWRGCHVSPSAIDQGERQAVMFMYSGILAGGGGPAPAEIIWKPFWVPRRRD